MRRLLVTALLAVCTATLTSAHTQSPSSPSVSRPQQITTSGTLRVCIWPDYHGTPFSNPKNGALTGIDATLSQAFARDLEVRVA